MPSIKLMNNSANFADATVDSTTVGQLRRELDIPASATVNVNQSIGSDSTEIADESFVAIVSNDKTGGK